MTTYNTKNPVPSADARDRYDNSQVFDDLMNGAAPSTPDRLGVLRQSWAGMEQAFAGSEADRAAAFQVFLEASGWSSLGAYAAGISITSHSQTVDYQGQPYQLKPSVPASIDAPYVTTSDWDAEGDNFKLVGDNSLRQDVTNSADPSKGAGMVGRSAQVINSIAALRDLLKTSVSAQALVTGYYASGDGGGGCYGLDSTDISTPDDGGTVIVATDGGRWKLSRQGVISAKQFGARGDGVSDDTAALQAFANYFGTGAPWFTANGGKGFIPKGIYKFSSQLKFDNPGINIVGESAAATILQASGDMAAGSAVLLTQTNTGYSNVAVSMSDITIDMAGFEGHGLRVIKPYDACEFKNIIVKNAGDNSSAFRIEPLVGNTDPVSQSIIFNGCEGLHKNVVAATPVWFLDSVQEAQLIGCKGFSWHGEPAKAPNEPFYFVNCRGITLLGCSSFGTSGPGIRIEATTRDSTGVQVIGHTYESCNQFLICTSTAGFKVSQVYHVGMRNEGSGSVQNGFVMSGAENCKIDTEVFSVTLDSNSRYNVITSRSGASLTDDGTANMILSTPSSASPRYSVVAESLLLQRKDSGSALSLEVKTAELLASGSTVISGSYPFAASTTGLGVLVNRAGTFALATVQIGTADSGGSGYRMLRILN